LDVIIGKKEKGGTRMMRNYKLITEVIQKRKIKVNIIIKKIEKKILHIMKKKFLIN
jgi:GTP cyclohydrolase FolE2